MKDMLLHWYYVFQFVFYKNDKSLYKDYEYKSNTEYARFSKFLFKK